MQLCSGSTAHHQSLPMHIQSVRSLAQGLGFDESTASKTQRAFVACCPSLRRLKSFDVSSTLVCRARSRSKSYINTSVVGKELESSVEQSVHAPTDQKVADAVAVGPHSLICDPDDLVLPPGQLSTVDRTSHPSPADTYLCAGCTSTECQNGCASNLWRFEPGGYLRAILTANVYEVAVETPLEDVPRLSEAIGNRILLKREDLQPVFSFKLRGAYNKMASLTPEQLERGVIASSAGNHAQGVALSAKKLGCAATICMPVTTPDIKVNAVRRLGATVELVGETYNETQAHAQARSAKDGLVFVAPYDDPYTIAGQGTIGAEILRQIGPEIDNIDAVFVAIGGGGLIAGVGAYIKALKPGIKVIGVEPSGANGMAQSLARGQRVTLSRVDAFADGVAVKHVGAETFRICREVVNGVVLVDNAAISAAIKDVFNDTRSILEPAGAVAVAGARAYCAYNDIQGKTFVSITSGANMNFESLRLVSEMADVGSQTEAMLATSIPEAPGSFKEFVYTATAGTNLSLTELKYRYSAGPEAHVLFSVGIHSPIELTALMERMKAKSYSVDDVSGMEGAQQHLRHLVGGRARSFTGELPNERIFQVDFPERAGALRRFLDAVCPEWNLTLLHYRTTGKTSSTVLVGLQVDPSTSKQFEAALYKLGSAFTFTELGSDALRIFRKFLS